MQLHELEVENYRAVRRARLSFGHTTVLIGENDSGKSSLLEALVRVLDGGAAEEPPNFESFQFHRDPVKHEIVGPIRIRIVFREREAGEWAGEVYAPIHDLLLRAGEDCREVAFELRAQPEGEVVWRLKSGKRKTSDPEVLRWLREFTPAIHLRAGMLTGYGTETLPCAPGLCRTGETELDEKIAAIEVAAERLISKTSPNQESDLEAGFKATRELLQLVTLPRDRKAPNLARRVREILGKGIDLNSSQPTLPGSNTSSEKLGILLLIAALLRVARGAMAKEMEPIWIIEDPEAHLHPKSLASISYFLSDIRWQKIITTYSGAMVGSMPLSNVRRLTRRRGVVTEHRVDVTQLSGVELRRIGYHLGAHRGAACFARMWLLVEGESEMWMLPQLARLCGYEFGVEGIECVEFAQSGLAPMIRVAEQLGIGWHVLADGDKAGQTYIDTIRRTVATKDRQGRFTLLNEPDIEHCFYKHGYAKVYQEHARLGGKSTRDMDPRRVIQRAVQTLSKPDLALRVIEAVAADGSPGVPDVLQKMIRTCVKVARSQSK
ncbi:ATP-dependent nuclease [Haloferula rosea]|uniref:DUF2813 domain-containing protein n=1 Tax=Haloferula rosea TaxID=490093 RepID=A0A934RBV1_9BACT|nr:DUF2813 domain-containing protein [Haloferula rosea]MBK1827783.1 DUF2813 domain-containing protein [Haloferula rosea]